MKNILKFVFGSFLMLTAIPIGIALHYFAITKFPYLTSEGYTHFINSSCFVYVLFQLVAGFILFLASGFKDKL